MVGLIAHPTTWSGASAGPDDRWDSGIGGDAHSLGGQDGRPCGISATVPKQMRRVGSMADPRPDGLSAGPPVGTLAQCPATECQDARHRHRTFVQRISPENRGSGVRAT